LKKIKVAIVHDWLVDLAGAEKVLEQILICFPHADIFSLVDHIPENQRDFLLNKKTKVSFIQQLPKSVNNFRRYLFLMPLAIEQFDLSSYDLIISSSHAVAKGVLTGPDQIHISYCHTPIRYAWDMQHQYLSRLQNQSKVKTWLIRYFLHKIRIWDHISSNGVDFFIANSRFVARRIKKIYRRDSFVLYPPVDTDFYTNTTKQKNNFYLTSSRLVSYKRVDLIVEAFNKMPEKQLIVIGSGPEYNRIKNKAESNVKVLGYQSSEVLRRYMQNAKAFIFAAEEDFGISPVEAQACGTPVIAFAKGGCLETVLDLKNSKSPTGVFFYEQNSDSICSAVNFFEKNIQLFLSENCRKNALLFSIQRFRKNFKKIIEKNYYSFKRDFFENI
jgi:glycosyltransferase involved in cell wall biosynthesis